ETFEPIDYVLVVLGDDDFHRAGLSWCPGCGAARNEVERCAADPGPQQKRSMKRSRVCSAPQRNQVYADCVNLPALLRCARDTRAFRRTGTSHHRLMPLDADAQHLVGVALPPVGGGENLDLAMAAIAGALHHGADCAQIDHAVAHHAAT